LHYFSVCPACKELVSEHKDVDFQRDQLAQTAPGQGGGKNTTGSEETLAPVEETETKKHPKKRQKVVMSTIEAATLVQQGKLCCTIGCSRRPVYNFKGLQARFCRTHKEDGMVTNKEKTCHEEGCENPAMYSHRGKRGKKLCEEHKEEGMSIITVCGLLCITEGCVKSASFNFRGLKARYCMAHKQPDMINLYREKKLCIHEGCNMSASFNLPDEKVARYCSTHRLKDMINLKSAICAMEGCVVQPYYNWRGEKYGKYCSKHKEPDMVNLLVIKANRVCDRSGCEKCACFAFAKSDSARYCSAHKERGMTDVQNTPCEHEDCGKRPNFNFPGIKKGRFCITHSVDGMVNVVNERRKDREAAVLVAASGPFEY
jgi:hypothetical protein